jgi:hypothetical protein
MDSNYLDMITKWERIYIHRCRLHLQVETLSDIATTDGTHINKTWYSNETTWRRFLSSFCDSSGKLKQPLGAWMRINENREHRAYLESGTNNLWYSKNNAWFIHEQIGKTRTSLIHNTTPARWKHKLKPSLTPTEILLEPKMNPYAHPTYRQITSRNQNWQGTLRNHGSKDPTKSTVIWLGTLNGTLKRMNANH